MPPELAPGAIPSPNIWNHPQVYEIENRAVDRDGLLTQLMQSLAPWDGRDVLDIGCGTGFNLPMFAERARSVVETAPRLSRMLNACELLSTYVHAGTGRRASMRR